MRVLVTGGSGFIGSALISELVKRSFEVWSFDRYKPTYGLPRPVPTFWGDITYYHSVQQAMETVQPEVVIHLAAYSSADPLGYEVPDEMFDVNARGTVNVAESARKVLGKRLKVFLFASSSEVYGNQSRFPLRELFKLKPSGSYHVAKIASEYYLRYLHDVFDFPAVILRPFNTYSEHMVRRTVVERAIIQMLGGKECRLGDPNPVRDFLYLSDHTNAYITCLEKRDKAIGNTFNFCTGRGVSIRELAEMIAEMTGFEGEIVWGTRPPRPCDIKKLVGSYEKAKRILGWEPKVSLEEGVKRCIEQFKTVARVDLTV